MIIDFRSIHSCLCLRSIKASFGVLANLFRLLMGVPNSQARSSRSYATLEPRVSKVSEAVIRKKWKKLPENSQVKLAYLLDGVSRQGLAKMAKKRNPKQAVNDLEVQDDGEEAVAELAGRYEFSTAIDL